MSTAHANDDASTLTRHEAASPVSVATWNVNGQSGSSVDAHLRFLESKGCGIVALQEVKEHYVAALRRHPKVHAVSYSLDLRPPEPDAPAKRRLGCAIVVLDPPIVVQSAQIIETTICPERTLVATLTVDGERIQVVSLHCPNGSKWGRDKAVWFHDVANWMQLQVVPTVFGIDANTPKNESLADAHRDKWWREDSHPAVGNGAQQLVGDSPFHDLRDVWKLLNPGASAFPPSYNRDSKGEKRPEYACRYDFIFASPHFTPLACDYHFEAVVGTTPRLSDHALVSATMRL